MTKIERRKHIRKAISMHCVVRFPSGITINDNTRDISLEGVIVESTSLSGTNKENLSLGEIGLITLKLEKGTVANSIMAPCQVKHLVANGVGLSVNFIELNKKELDLLEQMIASGKTEVDSH
jgi:hypothetical protein